MAGATFELPAQPPKGAVVILADGTVAQRTDVGWKRIGSDYRHSWGNLLSYGPLTVIYTPDAD
jgi:hypothetical protein